MERIQHVLEEWSKTLPTQVSVADMLSRCPIAHKWRAPYRSAVIRESLAWRVYDLGRQILLLMQSGHVMGARILLRSTLETAALLMYLNQKTEAVVAGSLSYQDFEQLTKNLLAGSKNESTPAAAVNILTVLDKAEGSHAGIVAIHKDLSETAHPNFDGVVFAYSSVDPQTHTTTFVNRASERFGARLEPAVMFVLLAFEYQYSRVWPRSMEALEAWLRANDSQLEKAHAAR
ncbi:DUF5677 domain-containing protein [Cognatilysobacter lacus]|uniref:Uncharacterized protein n=1 Tax=Cognatilysobacter lacus TaxID=1643323 RepID=A0A5D8YSP2_9GAMM|nr:DUF5677 domain-containing protein [Lysobacter lacus]TZF83344.1 hypothetical protein FW784_13115 [Lysobacter lacus]